MQGASHNRPRIVSIPCYLAYRLSRGFWQGAGTALCVAGIAWSIVFLTLPAWWDWAAHLRLDVLPFTLLATSGLVAACVGCGIYRVGGSMRPVLPLTRQTVAALAAPECLLRASRQPPADLSRVLLRSDAAHDPPEELLRPGDGSLG